jgi:hypothetical protein
MGVMLSMIMDKFCKGKVFDPCFRVGMTVDLKVRCDAQTWLGSRITP